MKPIQPVTSHKKRFGQYFSGDKVANLLCLLLPNVQKYDSIIDPMAGTGDLLNAAMLRALPTTIIRGIEIDEPIAELCKKRLPNAEIICGDAFKNKKLITSNGWDLVITNPPYVRYQIQKEDSSVMPSRDLIRDNLISMLKQLPYLEEQEKNLLLKVARNYSGLADMAVPSWILCAALVGKKGILAMVVPETWLNREYAKPIQYLLLKNFEIIRIARDVNACWFENAQVRTCLIIARKKKISNLAEAANHDTVLVNLSSLLVDEQSLVGRLVWDGLSGESAFVNLLSNGSSSKGVGFSLEKRNTSSVFPNLFSDRHKLNWILPEDLQSNKCYLPFELANILNNFDETTFLTLEDLGIQCGQGLRTGANDFFYLNLHDKINDCFLCSGNWFESDYISIPQKFIVRCIQNRRQIDGIVVDPQAIKTGVLYIQDSVRSTDLEKCASSVLTSFKVLPESVESYITNAEKYRNPRGLLFKEYSAVKTNEKKRSSKYERFWYMLPSLSARHLPQLCITRICSEAAECIYIPQTKEPIAIDANFVTLWGSSEDTIKACFAMLNSTWSKCYLELLCTVMGGGALKIEAAHIRKIMFPILDHKQLFRLSRYGEQIIAENKLSRELLDSIDSTVLENFKSSVTIIRQIKELLQKKLDERGNRNEL